LKLRPQLGDVICDLEAHGSGISSQAGTKNGNLPRLAGKWRQIAF
jgi:hypothetical protein